MRWLRLVLASTLLIALAAACVGRNGVAPVGSITGITPANAIIDSGTRITIEGRNFSRIKGAEAGAEQDLSVLVCGVPLSDVQLDVQRERTVMLPPASSVSLQIGDEITGVLGDRASSGMTDVIITVAGGQQLVLPDAFECLLPGVDAVINANATNGPAPLTVEFDASDSISHTGTVTTYTWDFGAGSTASGETATHTFTNPDKYLVTLLVTDDVGDSDEATVEIEVTNTAPIAAFTMDPPSGTATAPLTVTFDAGTSEDPNGDPLTYSWAIGETGLGTEVSATHEFPRSGTFTVSLTVTDSHGAADTTEQDYIVGNAAPIAAFRTNPDPATGSAPLPVTFDANESSDPDGTIDSYTWDFGDGGTGIGAHVAHTFATGGLYNVTLTVTDDEGLTDSSTTQVSVDNSPPTARITATPNPATGPAPLTVEFDASDSSDPDGSIETYSWDLGGGATARGQIISHTFTEPGTHMVELQITDNDGANDDAIVEVTVTNTAPIPEFTVDPASGTAAAPLNVTFDAGPSSDPNGHPITYYWEVDGTDSGTDETLTHEFLRSGTYTVSLTVTDSHGAAEAAEQYYIVNNARPVAEANVESIDGYVVSLNASGSSDPDGSIDTYEWTFGDGSTGTGINVTHTYSASGPQTVILTVTDDEGSTASHEVVITTVNLAPTAVITTTPASLEGFAPLYIQLDGGQSFDELGGEITDYLWTYPDGTTATGPEIELTLETPGAYTFTLQVTDNEGETGTESITAYASAGEIESVTIVDDVQSLQVGDTTTLTAEVVTVGVVDDTVAWNSSNTSVVTVDTQSGAVTAVSAGMATVTAMSTADNTVSDSVTVYVTGGPLGTVFDEFIDDMAIDENGNVYLAGYYHGDESSVALPSPQGADALLLKLDSNGELIWRRAWSTPGYDRARAIAISPTDGSVFLVGQAGGDFLSGVVGASAEGFVMKVTPSGETEWFRQYGSCGSDYATDVVVDAQGEIYLTGVRNENRNADCEPQDWQVLAAKYSPAGDQIWYGLYGSGNDARGISAAVGSSGHIIIAGDHVDAFETTPEGDEASFLLTLNPQTGASEQHYRIGSGALDTTAMILVADDGTVFWIGRDYEGVAGSYRTTTVRALNGTTFDELEVNQFTGEYHSTNAAALDSDGNVVLIPYGHDEGGTIEVVTLDGATLQVIERTPLLSQDGVSTSITGIGWLPDGTLVLTGATNTTYLGGNQGGSDPFIWLPFGP